MSDRPYNVLFLCTGNSARSIIAEAILNKVGAGKFHTWSAGSQPKGRVHPETIRLLRSLGYDTSGFRSKSWNEFAADGAPEFDFVFTVCDNAAAEIALAFKDSYRMLHQRIGIFVSLPLRSLEELSLQKKLDEIGRMEGATAKAAEPT